MSVGVFVCPLGLDPELHGLETSGQRAYCYICKTKSPFFLGRLSHLKKKVFKKINSFFVKCIVHSGGVSRVIGIGIGVTIRTHREI